MPGCFYLVDRRRRGLSLLRNSNITAGTPYDHKYLDLRGLSFTAL